MRTRYSLRDQPLAWRLIVTAVVLIGIAAWTLGVGTRAGAVGGGGNVDQWKSAMRLLSATSGCRRVETKAEGGSGLVQAIIVAHETWKWCWDAHGFTSVDAPNKWHSESWGWHFDGYDTVSGSGAHYRYKRIYFNWSRTPSQLPLQTARPFLSITIRDDGTCVLDKYQQPGTISCNEAAGGGGGGSW